MKKFLKVLGKTLGILLAIAVVFLLGTFTYNRIMLANEKQLLADQDLARMVEVDGQKMSVYVSGEGEHTLVFMAGSGDAAPIIDYKDFADRFDKDFRVVIVEKFGYGFSDGFDGSRSVDTRVCQQRKALQSLGIEGPFILCPHSYSGLESIYWAQNFPDEVEAIVGLDMAVPRAYDTYDDKVVSLVTFSNFAKEIFNKAGIVRLFVGPTLPDDTTEEENKLITALVCRNYGNETAGDEVKYVASDIAVIDRKPVPDVPTLLIISDGTVADGWIGFETDYASSVSDVTTVQLDCGHSVFDYEPDECEDAMRTFIVSLSLQN